MGTAIIHIVKQSVFQNKVNSIFFFYSDIVILAPTTNITAKYFCTHYNFKASLHGAWGFPYSIALHFCTSSQRFTSRYCDNSFKDNFKKHIQSKMVASKVTLAVLFEKAIGSKLREINSLFFFRLQQQTRVKLLIKDLF